MDGDWNMNNSSKMKSIFKYPIQYPLAVWGQFDLVMSGDVRRFPVAELTLGLPTPLCCHQLHFYIHRSPTAFT